MLLGLIGVWYDNFFGAETLAVLPYSHYLAQLTAVPPAARHGEQRQVGRPARASRSALQTGDDRVGPARHQRPARLLPADPPGHEADPGRLHRLRQPGPRGRRPPGPASWPTSSPSPRRWRSARPPTRCEAEGVPEHQVAAPHVRRQPPDQRRSSSPSCRRSALGQLIAALRAQGVHPGRDLGHQQLRPVGRRAGQEAGPGDHPRARPPTTSPTWPTTRRPTPSSAATAPSAAPDRSSLPRNGAADARLGVHLTYRFGNSGRQSVAGRSCSPNSRTW